MGLVILITIIVAVLFTTIWDEPKTKVAALKAIGVNIILSLVVGFLVGGSISAVVPVACKNIKTELEDRQIYELSEISSGIYLTTGVSAYTKAADQPNVTVITDEGKKTVELRYCSIYLNNDNCAMEVRTYKYKSKILNILLFNCLDDEYDIYVPQSNLDGLYSIHTN